MKTCRIPYNQLVSILADYKECLKMDHIDTPFKDAHDRKLSAAAGEYLKLYILSHQRFGTRQGAPFRTLLAEIGYPLHKMKRAEIDDLEVDLDELALRLQSYAGFLLHPIAHRLAWRDLSLIVDGNLEEIVLTIGEDHRITEYYRMVKEQAEAPQAHLVKLPRVITEVDDLEDVEHTFNALIDSVFAQVDNDAVRQEIKQKFIRYISEKN